MTPHPRFPLLPSPALAAAFPSSTARASSLFTFVGATPDATAAVRRVLEENDRAYDIYMRLRFAHNHFPHSALTRYALGAPPALLQATWEADRGPLVPLDPAAEPDRDGKDAVASLPHAITAANWASKTTLGVKPAYALYLTFFHSEVARLGPEGVVAQYLLSPESAGGADGPELLIRLLAGVTHPFIHLGLGLEFGDRVVLAEALACAAVHSHENNVGLFPAGWPHAPLPQSAEPNAPLLALYAALLADPRLDPGPWDPEYNLSAGMRAAVAGERAGVLQRLVARWDLSDVDAALPQLLEEAAWLATLLACGTSKPGYATRIDFFLMHVLTSSLFLAPVLAPLGATARRAVLQSYVLTIFQIALARGRPRLYPAESMSWTAAPAPKAAPAVPAPDAIGGPSSAAEQNPWLAIVANALVAKDSHVPKTIRALLHYSQLYGGTPAGGVPGAGAVGGHMLDGTLFVRAAGRVMDATGWQAAGERERNWDRSGLGWDAVWDKPGWQPPRGSTTGETAARPVDGKL
ncbi:hypothetical protein VHUM_03923 [Vanrija humicola]|uniref:Oxidoreductase AflY n=1 Tax=Vanrija humicola TaxID=5417 RepID=A0A7D8YWM5_VANHU|nr:hypothetical protein VHUM_03923 [Vanrija humicola]